MSEALEIAPVSLLDLDAIERIESECFAVPWRREFFESELEGDGSFCLAARSGDVLAGYLFATVIADELHINKIAVTPSMRRRGIAVALMARCFEFAAQNGLVLMILEVRKSNEDAQAFYRQLGFRFSYSRPRYYPDGESAVVMTFTPPGSR